IARSHQLADSAFVIPRTRSPSVFAAAAAFDASRDPIATSCSVRSKRCAKASPSFPVPPSIAIFTEINPFLPALVRQLSPFLDFLPTRNLESTPPEFRTFCPSQGRRPRPAHPLQPTASPATGVHVDPSCHGSR